MTSGSATASADVGHDLAMLALGGLARAAQVVVSRDGHVLAEGCVGAGPDTRFLLWSISKPLTAATVLALVDRRLLSLDTAVAALVPAFAARGKGDVTVRDVLLHLGGFPDVVPGEPPKVRLDMNEFRDWTAGVRAVCALDPLPAWQGRPVYHPMSFGILGAVVERAAALPFRQACRDLVLDPLDMQHTTWGLPEEVSDAALPQLDVDALATVRRGLVPAGNAWSTARDLARFYAMLASGGVGPRERVLGEQAVKGMQSPLTAQPGVGGAFGFGTMVDTEDGPVFARGTLSSRRCYGHSGATATQSWHDPVSGLTLVALTDAVCSQQESDARFDRLADEVNTRFAE